MPFKSYCWCLGNTSFRVQQLNYKNELQLKYLSELFYANPNSSWRDLQIKYYDLLASKNFVKGTASNKAKDARELTSGLADIGLVDRDTRFVTSVGDELNKISENGDYSSDNVFEISKDSYVYLLQFLKMQIYNDEMKIKPFISLIYMIAKLGYLSREEFTYLLPICLTVDDVLKTTVAIKNGRGKNYIDSILINKMMSMENYIEAYNILINSDIVDENIMAQVGLNRKSGDYDKPFAPFFNTYLKLSVERNQLSEKEKLELLKKLKEELLSINSNQNAYWKKLLQLTTTTKIDTAYLNKFYDVKLSNSDSVKNFKDQFFKMWHLMKWKSTLADYYDLNKRYFNLTDIIKYRNEKFELTELAELYFADIIDELLFSPFQQDDVYFNNFKSFITIENIFSQCNKTKKDIVELINKKHKIKISTNQLEDYMEDLKNKEFMELIDEKFGNDVLIELLECFEVRDDKRIFELITDEATPSTCFEYVLGIIWYNLSGREGRLLDYMNLSLDSNYLPKTHAAGGEADLVFKYSKSHKYLDHHLLLEATLSEGAGQRHMEYEPVARHLENHRKKTHNDRDYVVFITCELHEPTVKSFRLLKIYDFNDNGREVLGMKVIPLNTQMVRFIIEHNFKYDMLYEIFEESYNSLQLGMNWFDNTIKSKFN